MVNPIGHWQRFPFCTRYWIPKRGLSGFWGIGFWVPVRGLYCFWVPPGLAVPSHHILVPVFQSFVFSVYIFLLLPILVLLFYDVILGGILWHNPLGFTFTLPRTCGNGLSYYVSDPRKYRVDFSKSFLFYCFIDDAIYCCIFHCRWY